MLLKKLNIDTIKRFVTLKTDRIFTLPIIILMPYGHCNCKCLMCNIWKGEKKSEKLNIDEVKNLCKELKRLGTKWVIMSGGEALMHPEFFTLCKYLRDSGLLISVLSTGLLLKENARELVNSTDEVIVSLDGTEDVHNSIRRVKDAHKRLSEGVNSIKEISPKYPISARSVIQRANYKYWSDIIDSAKEIGLDKISFLPADVSSAAFNRSEPWSKEQTEKVILDKEQLPELKNIIENLIAIYKDDIDNGFVVETPKNLMRIHDYYAAHYGLNEFPKVFCNAPWVSAVVESDGAIKPCFFHPVIGNIREGLLTDTLNKPSSIDFRKGLDVNINPICSRCVCTLLLNPSA